MTLEKRTPLLPEVLRGSGVLGKRKGGCPSIPRAPTSPMELVGNRSPSAGAQLHPGREEGRSDEREKRERNRQRDRERDRQRVRSGEKERERREQKTEMEGEGERERA